METTIPITLATTVTPSKHTLMSEAQTGPDLS